MRRLLYLFLIPLVWGGVEGSRGFGQTAAPNPTISLRHVKAPGGSTPEEDDSTLIAIGKQASPRLAGVGSYSAKPPEPKTAQPAPLPVVQRVSHTTDMLSPTTPPPLSSLPVVPAETSAGSPNGLPGGMHGGSPSSAPSGFPETIPGTVPGQGVVPGGMPGVQRGIPSLTPPAASEPPLNSMPAVNSPPPPVIRSFETSTTVCPPDTSKAQMLRPSKDGDECPIPFIWARAEYIQWIFKQGTAPPLVTTGPDNLLPTIDRAGTRVLSGNDIGGTNFPGGRLTFGFGLPNCDVCKCCPHWGIEGNWLWVPEDKNSNAFSSRGIPVLGRPFFDVSTGTAIPVVQSVANLGGVGGLPALGGTVTVSDSLQFYGGELNLVCNACFDSCKGYKVDLIGGFRYLALHESLSIMEDLLALDGTNEANIVRDNFATKNDFYGGQVGVRGEKSFGRFFVGGTGKLALGVMRQEVTINGSTTNTVPGTAPATGVGGLLAQTSNIGRYEQNEFAVIPEVELRVGWQVTRYLRVFGGWNFLYISSVARPGNQIDPNVNTNLLPSFLNGVPQPPLPGGPAQPAFRFNTTDFWAHGATVGAEVRW